MKFSVLSLLAAVLSIGTNCFSFYQHGRVLKESAVSCRLLQPYSLNGEGCIIRRCLRSFAIKASNGYRGQASNRNVDEEEEELYYEDEEEDFMVIDTLLGNDEGDEHREVSEVEEMDFDGEVDVEKALDELFMRQLQENREEEQIQKIFSKESQKVLSAKELVETSSELEEGCPVEVLYKGKILFANFLSRKEKSNSLNIRTSAGESLTIDSSQLISSWDLIADENNPETSRDWARVAAEAVDLLRCISPRKSDLREFWQLISQRSNTIPVDSLDLGIYIFQERKFRTWIDPYALADAANVRALSAAQRYAAALLLNNDDIHFKRRPSRLLTDEEVSQQTSIEDFLATSSMPGTFVVEGGYKVLDESIVLFKECEIFEKYLQSKSKKEGESGDSSPFRAACVTRQIRELEMYSLSPENLQPPKAVRALLKRLKASPSPSGAKKVLLGSFADRNSGSPELARKSLLTKLRKDKDINRTYSVVSTWGPGVLESAAELKKEMESKKVELVDMPISRVGKIGVNGRADYRGNILEHPVICMDAKDTSFYDDAFSLSPETGEVLVHVVDVASVLRKYPMLLDTAKERIGSTFLPSGPSHMLPPQALDCLKLSSTSPNEVITVAISIDGVDGKIYGYRVFPSIIGPVTPVDVETADEILAGVGVDVSGDSKEISTRFGYSNELVKDIRTLGVLIEKTVARETWIDSYLQSKQISSYRLNKKTGRYRQVEFQKSGSNRIVNALLTLYSNATHRYCTEKEINVPVAWMNRDKEDSSRIRRFGTSPLRNWIAQLQQKQIRAALKMELPLTRDECALAVSHHNNKRKAMSSLLGKGREQMSFESFEAHCATILASGQESVVLTAEGIGKGGYVKLKPFNLNGVVSSSVEKGELVQVKVKKIQPESKSILLDLVK